MSHSSLADTPLYPLLGIARHRIGIDGNGVTTLVAGAGCPLRCRFCINQEILRKKPGSMVSPEGLLERVEIDDLYFRATGGGVTFGGGESLLHAAFIRSFRDLCPSEWKIRTETSLAVPKENVRIVAAAADEFIVDCKELDPDRYYAYTGGDVSLMTDNLGLLLDLVGPQRIIVRVPLIPGFNTVSDRDKNARILQDMGFEKLDLFEYVIRKNSGNDDSPQIF